MTFVWILVGVVGALIMMAASHVAIRHAVALSERLGAPPLLVGISVVALGTDLPEIVNSVVASYLGHGDINVGDSIGSVFTQGSLVLGLIPFGVARALDVKPRVTWLVVGSTIVVLSIGAWLLRDGALSRLDALGLLLAWLVVTALAWRVLAEDPESDRPAPATGGALGHGALALLALAVVGGGASGLVHAVAGLSATLEIPEYVLSFFGAALGTSLPELVVNLTAMRRGHREIALGGVLGACLMDASVSIAAGPLLFPNAVTPGLALRGAAVAIGTMLVVALLLGFRGKHDRSSGMLLIAMYLFAYLVLGRSA